MTKRRLAFHGVTLLEGTGGLTHYALSALEALRRGPEAEDLQIWLPSALRDHEGLGALPPVPIHFYRAPHPRRGFAFNHLFWVNCLALHLRRRANLRVFSPIELHSVYPLRHPLVTAHDCYADHFGDPRKGGKVGLGRRLCVRQMRRSQIMAVSEFTAHELAELHGLRSPQVTVVPNWLSRDFASAPSDSRVAVLREELGLPTQFWLYVGGFRLNKNLPLLFEAYAQARRLTPCPPLVIAGRIPEEDTPFSGPFHAAIDAHPGLRETIIFPGFIPDEDLGALYRAADLAICPSSYEGFGYPPLEAAAMGTPVLAARATSFPELGLPPKNLFSPTDPADLAAKLSTFARHEFIPHFPFPDRYRAEPGEARFNAVVATWLAGPSQAR